MSLLLKLLKNFLSDGILGSFTAALFCLWVNAVYLHSRWTGLRFWLVILGVWLVTSLIFGLVYAFLIHPAFHKITTRERFWVTTICLLIGAGILTYGQPSLPNLIKYHANVNISCLAESNPASTGSEVRILSFREGQTFISYQVFTPQGNWTRDEQSLVSPSDLPANLNWSGYGTDLSITFQTNSRAGKVSLDWGNDRQVLDLYSAEEGSRTIHYQNQPVLTPITDGLIYGLFLGFCMLLLAGWVILAWSRDVKPAEKMEKPTWDKNTLFWMGLAFLLGVIYLAVLTHQYGARIITDSINYLSAARHLIQGQGYIALNNDTFDWWPPLYPMILSIFQFMPVTAGLEAARWLNFVFFGLTLAGVVYLVRQMLPKISNVLMLGFVMVLVTARPLVIVFSYLLSDPLFIVTWVLAAVFLFRYFKYRHVLDVLVLALFVSLHILSRYIGVVWLAVIILGLWVFLPGKLVNRLERCASFSAAAGAGIAIWVARNYWLTGMFTGPRTPSRTSLGESLLQAWNVLNGWFFPPYLGLLLLAGGLIGGLFVYLRRKENRSFQSPAAFTLVILGMFVLFYPAYLIISFSSLVMNTPVDDRYLSPIFIPFLLILLYLLESFKSHFERVKITWFQAALLLVFLIQPIFLAVGMLNTRPYATSGTMTLYYFEQSPLIERLKNTRLPDLPLYSNCQRCMYLFADIHPATIFDENPDNRPFMPAGPADFPMVLVWFNRVQPEKTDLPLPRPVPNFETLLDLKVNATTLVETSDGGVYQLTLQNP